MSKKKPKTIEEYIKTKMEKSWEKTKKEWDFFDQKAKEAIKHPHFEYACIDNVDRIIYIRIKPFWKWFSGKKMVTVKIHKITIDNSGWLGTTNSNYHLTKLETKARKEEK